MGVYGFGTWSPESTQKQDGIEHIMQFSYTAPMTSKLLIEAAYSQFFSNWNPTAPAGALDQEPFIPIQEQSLAGGVPVPNMVYHGYAGLNNNHQTHNVWRGALSYVTGAHSMKVGYAAAYEVTDIFGDFPTHCMPVPLLDGAHSELRASPNGAANRTRYYAFYCRYGPRKPADAAGARATRTPADLPRRLERPLTDSRYGSQPHVPSANVGTPTHIAPRRGLATTCRNGNTASSELSITGSSRHDGVYIAPTLPRRSPIPANRRG